MNPRALRTSLKFLGATVAAAALGCALVFAMYAAPLWVFPVLCVVVLIGITVVVYRAECRADRERAAS